MSRENRKLWEPGSWAQKNVYPLSGPKHTKKALCSTHEHGLMFCVLVGMRLVTHENPN